MPENAPDAPAPAPAPQPPTAADAALPIAPVTRPRRRWLSPVWIIPVVAALLGLWLVFKYYSAQGPEITVRFETAEGIVAGKTPILCRSVNVGTVGTVRLSQDLKGVIITADMTKDAERLLTKDTQIWVVRARYSSAGISGLNTIVSGNYLELQPGVSKEEGRHYMGLETPPVTPPGVPGLRLKLISESAGGLDSGAGIWYKGVSVGKIEKRVFHPETGEVEFEAFINNEFANLIDKNTRFWNNSGIDLKVGPDGVKLRSGTLESILAGGITFNEPDHIDLGKRHVDEYMTFTLYDSYDDAARKTELNPAVPYLLLFTGSVRGLSVDAPVEFRGIKVGTVFGINFKYLPDDPDRRVPVLIKIDPAMLFNLTTTDYTAIHNAVDESVNKGLRASLKTGSLITGQLYVDLDFIKDAPPATVAKIEGYQVIPTVASGLGEIQVKINLLLDKINALPLDKTLDTVNVTLASLKDTLKNLNDLLAQKDTQELPASLRKDLDALQKTLAGYNGQSDFYENLSKVMRQLDDTLRSVKGLTGTLENHPNSLIFGKPGDGAAPKGSH